MEETIKKKLGVVIGRFQLHQLHDGHLALINYVKSRNERTIVYIGTSPVKLSQKNPLPFMCREDALQYAFKGLEVYPIMDHKSDDAWSAVLDEHLTNNFSEYDICLYGSRDSFIDNYKGKYRCEFIPHDPSHVPATTLRKGISKELIDDENFRKGIIWATLNRFPISYQCVDIACIKKVGDQKFILLGQKEGESKWRLPGGFVDTTDTSLEYAATREFYEECGHGCSVDNFKYLGSFRIDDWRYRGEADQIMTALFKCDYIHGIAQASDDLKEVKWFDLSGEVPLEPEHMILFNQLKQSV